MSRFVIACGGTGGHLAPGIAVAEELISRGHECVLLLSRKNVDRRFAAKYQNIRFESIPGCGLSLKPAKFAAFVWSQLRAVSFSLRLLRERPAAVMAFGGFTSMGVVLAAAMKRVPVILHEANRNPGRAVRVLRHFASRLYLPEGVRLNNVPMRLVRHPGYPVRREIACSDREAAKTALGFDSGAKLLAVIGGSQGAAALNDWAVRNAKTLCASGISLCCISGPDKDVPEELDMPGHSGVRAKTRFIPFCEQMGLLLSAADIVVSRAGAGSIAELVECGVPSILVPYPYAADNHQAANARYLECQGGCVVVDQTRIEGLLSEVLDLAFNDWLLNRMHENLARIRNPRCAADIVDDILSIGVAGESDKPSAAEEVLQK